jgi:hypothetical protein
VDDHLDLFALRLLACPLDGLALRVGRVADALRPFLPGGPAVVVGDDVDALSPSKTLQGEITLRLWVSQQVASCSHRQDPIEN